MLLVSKSAAHLRPWIGSCLVLLLALTPFLRGELAALSVSIVCAGCIERLLRRRKNLEWPRAGAGVAKLGLASLLFVFSVQVFRGHVWPRPLADKPVTVGVLVAIGVVAVGILFARSSGEAGR